MAKIALRVYNNEISDLIDHGQIDEAIAHCRHILEVYPRYIETYQLFGKSYLESNRYGDAADIFQRVISSVPDDFVSQIGMSIIREDEGKLDAAIYHMERTFEAQPSNQAIQEELRRLYGRRDGVEPAKIRLTRGALARMYAHGNLYEQAVAELSSALTEDPSRLDLNILLAEMFFKMDKHVEAADISINILEKLPNNLSANRILYFILSNSNREEESNLYKQRWVSLDPYAEHISKENMDPSQVSDNKVTIEKLTWDPDEYAEQFKSQPEWASSLGVTVEDEDNEDKHNWLFKSESEEETIKNSASQETRINKNDSSDTNIFQENEDNFSKKTDSEGSEGEIPDWILEGIVETETDEEESIKDDFPDMVKEFDINSDQEEELDKDDNDKSVLPEWMLSEIAEEDLENDLGISESELNLGEPEQVETNDNLEESKDEAKDWLEALSDTGPFQKDELEVTSGEEEAADTIRFNKDEPENTPDWLKELADTGQFVKEDPEETPDWLKAAADVGELVEEDSEELPDWLSELGESALSSNLEPEEQPDWMQTEDIQPPDPSTVNVDDDADWLKDLSEASSKSDTFQELDTNDNEKELFKDDEENALAWLESQESDQVETENLDASLENNPESIEAPSSDESSKSENDSDNDAIAWLERIDNKQDLSPDDSTEGFADIEDILLSEEDTDEEKGVADWLNSLLEDGAEDPVKADDDQEWMQSIAQLAPESEDQPAPGDMDWLKELDQAAVNEDDQSIRSNDAEDDSIEWKNESKVLDNIEATNVAESEIPEDLELQNLNNIIKNDDKDDVDIFITSPGIEARDLPTEMSGLFISNEAEGSEEDALTEPLDQSKMPDWMKEITEANGPAEELSKDLNVIADQQSPTDAPPFQVETDKELTGDWVLEPERDLELEVQKITTQRARPAQKVKKQISSELLLHVKDALSSGDIDEAVSGYKKLIKKGVDVDKIIENINIALRRYPLDVNIWQVLGDAYMKQNRLQDALDAFIKAEELLR